MNRGSSSAEKPKVLHRGGIPKLQPQETVRAFARSPKEFQEFLFALNEMANTYKKDLSIENLMKTDEYKKAATWFEMLQKTYTICLMNADAGHPEVEISTDDIPAELISFKIEQKRDNIAGHVGPYTDALLKVKVRAPEGANREVDILITNVVKFEPKASNATQDLVDLLTNV